MSYFDIIPQMNDKPWYKSSEEEILDRKISSLGLEIQGTKIDPWINSIYDELKQKGLVFTPPCFLADEWFCPVNVPAIGIPFYLAHHKLSKLEEKIILEVEGGTKSWFSKLLRHEIGHAYTYAFRLNRKPKWIKLFGKSSKSYEDTYSPRPYSRSFVMHLDGWYAQSHPDEDFAETFAVWLNPHINWKRRYRGWKAIKKLEYVDKLMQGLKNKEPLHNPKFNPKDFSGLNIKLKTYFQRKRKLYEESFPDFYDKDLKIIFSEVSEDKNSKKAYQFLKSKRKELLNTTAFWTQEKKYTINQLIDELIERSKELNLYTPKNKDSIEFNVSSYISSMIMNRLFTGKFKRKK